MVHFNLNYLEVETIFDFYYLATPLFLSMTSIVIGELKQRSLKNGSDQEKSIQDLNQTISHLRNKDLVLEKENIELKKRIVSKLDTARSFFDIATSFHSVEEEVLLDNLKEALIRLYKTTKVSIIGQVDLVQDDLDVLTRSAMRLKKQATLEDVYSLKDFPQNDDIVLVSIPLIIEGRIEYVVRISGIPFLDYIPSNFKLSDLYGSWVCDSLKYGRAYQKSMKSSIWNEELKVYQHNYFKERIGEEFDRSKTYMLPLTMMKVKIDSLRGFSSAKSLTVRKIICGILAKHTRKLDYVSEGRNIDEFYVVFPIFDGSATKNLWDEVNAEFKKLNLLGESGALHLEGKIREFNPSMNSVDDFTGDFN